MGEMNFRIRDLYPNEGVMTTHESTIPDAIEQRTLQENEKAVDVAESTLNGATKSGTYGVILGIFLAIVVIGMLSF